MTAWIAAFVLFAGFCDLSHIPSESDMEAPALCFVEMEPESFKPGEGYTSAITVLHRRSELSFQYFASRASQPAIIEGADGWFRIEDAEGIVWRTQDVYRYPDGLHLIED